MNLPTYDKTKRRSTFQQLPKNAYVIRIKDAKQDKWPSGDDVIRIAFDIAEGEYAGFYQKIFDGSSNEDKKWPMDAVYNLNVPNDRSESYVWSNWNTFFADLEDSNGGFIFSGDLTSLRGKVIGGKFHNHQSKGNDGTVYDHIVMRWSCPADDVREGKFWKLPNDKLVKTAEASGGDSSFVAVKDDDETVPF